MAPQPVGVDAATGALVVGGERHFPIGVSNPPPLGKRAPNGKEGLDELASVGTSFIRTGRGDWRLGELETQIAEERALLDAAAKRGLRCWLWLGDAPNLPAQPSQQHELLHSIVGSCMKHPALGAYKSVDEPRNPLRGDKWIRPAGLVRGYKAIKAQDPDHPVVIVQAPRSTVAELSPYRPAFDVTGADIFPIAYPPGQHSDLRNRDISVVGDVTAKMRQAAGAKPVWTTLQIAWSGTARSQAKPDVLPRFPSLREERFMAYQAIVAGARGLMFFGGHLTQVCTPDDAKRGWNWTFWRQVLRPLVSELSSEILQPALVSPDVKPGVATTSGDVQLVTRRAGSVLYVLAVRRGGAVSQIAFSGLPAGVTRGEVLFEYVQQPPPPPFRPDKQVLRPVAVAGGGFRDWFAAHDARVYRFS